MRLIEKSPQDAGKTDELDFRLYAGDKGEEEKPKLRTSSAETINTRVSDETGRRGAVQQTHSQDIAGNDGDGQQHTHKANDLPFLLRTLCPAGSCRKADEKMVNSSQWEDVHTRSCHFSVTQPSKIEFC